MILVETIVTTLGVTALATLIKLLERPVAISLSGEVMLWGLLVAEGITFRFAAIMNPARISKYNNPVFFIF